MKKIFGMYAMAMAAAMFDSQNAFNPSARERNKRIGDAEYEVDQACSWLKISRKELWERVQKKPKMLSRGAKIYLEYIMKEKEKKESADSFIENFDKK